MSSVERERPVSSELALPEFKEEPIDDNEQALVDVTDCKESHAEEITPVTMPNLYLHTLEGKLLCKITLDTLTISPGFKVALHIIAARYLDPRPLEEWVRLTWDHRATGAIYVTAMIRPPLNKEDYQTILPACECCESTHGLIQQSVLRDLCARCGSERLCWTCAFWGRGGTPLCMTCMTEDEAGYINLYRRSRRAAMIRLWNGYYDRKTRGKD